MAIDPVCGMQVDEKRAAETFKYKGETYYFCAPGCKAAFTEDPEKYLRQQEKYRGRESQSGHYREQ